MKKNWVDILGAAAFVVGLVAEFVGNWVGAKQTEQMMDEKIAAALEAKNK